MNPTHEHATEVDRRSYLKATGLAVAGAVGLAGCSATASATGTLATRVTDQPGDIADFDSCVVTIQGIWAKPSESEGETDASDGTEATGGTDTGGDDDGSDAVAEQDEGDVDESDGREYHEFDEPQEADLVKLQNGNTSLVDERDLETGQYEFLQLDVSDVDGVLADGSQATVATPGNAPLQFNEPFEIREGQTTTFTGDFTPVKRGRTERYLLQPVPSGITVDYGDQTDTETPAETDTETQTDA